jgi:predicted nucleic acid-binding protein
MDLDLVEMLFDFYLSSQP